jgi:hypothetical protein
MQIYGRAWNSRSLQLIWNVTEKQKFCLTDFSAWISNSLSVAGVVTMVVTGQIMILWDETPCSLMDRE